MLSFLTQIKNPANLKTIAIAIEERRFSWNLTDFFKIFFIHSLIILLFLMVYLAFRFKDFQQVFSFF